MRLTDHQPLVFTIDSGASENVISEGMATQFQAKPSEGSPRWLSYTAANATTMANQGEQEVTLRTSEGYGCMLKIQVTDV